MNGTYDRLELERLRDAVGELIGFGFEEDRLEQLAHTLRGRIQELGLARLDDYSQRLRAVEHRPKELPIVAELVTVTETFFHRSYDQIRAFLEVVVPERRARGERRLRILSAGCASGEEPFTLAIGLREKVSDIDDWDVQIVGVDVNPAMLEKARRARYSKWALRSVPEAIQARYFERAGSEFQLSDEIRRMVEFRSLNLADRSTWPFENWGADAVFCRNVLMYFAPGIMRDVVQRLTQTLASGGYLFLGHAETLRGVSHEYHLCHTHETFYYQERGGLPRIPLEPAERSTAERSVSEQAAKFLPEVVEGQASWFDAIQAASRRIDQIAEAHGTASRLPVAAAPSRASAGRSRLPEVMELMQRELFSDALSLLESLPSDQSSEPDAMLLSSILLTNHGRIAEAERACEKLLGSDDLNAGAHYLKALCREHAGDKVGALEHDRIAAHLDPTFAMPKLHAGLLAKRAHEPQAARHELSQALGLLEREDMSRILLFGGGFSREALISLCRTELERTGEGA